MEDIFHCDWKGCKRLPFVEVFPIKGVDKDSYPKFGGWSYLCLWHFLIARVQGDKIAWCYLGIKDYIKKGNYEDE